MSALAAATSDEDDDEIKELQYRLHAAKGRYHTQIAACDLFNLFDLKNERPKK